MSTFPWEVEPVTVVIGMKESDAAILLAADGEATADFGYKKRTTKLVQVHDMPIAWGSAGNPVIGREEFGEWAQSYDWTSKSWKQASKDALDALLALNGAQRRRTIEIAQTTIGDGFLADIILVGWLQGEPGMFALSDDGRITPFWEQEFYSIGTGARYAVPAYNTLAMIGALERNPRVGILKTIVEGVISFAPNCGPPADCWRVTQGGVEHLFTLEHRLEEQSEKDNNEQ